MVIFITLFLLFITFPSKSKKSKKLVSRTKEEKQVNNFIEDVPFKTQNVSNSNRNNRNYTIWILLIFTIVIIPLFISVYFNQKTENIWHHDTPPNKVVKYSNSEKETQPINKKIIQWEEIRFQGFKFKVPSNYNSTVELNNTNSYSFYFRDNVNLNINRDFIPKNKSDLDLDKLITNGREFAIDVTKTNKNQFPDYNLDGFGFSTLGNNKAFYVENSSRSFSKSGELISIFSYFLIFDSYYYTFTFSAPKYQISSIKLKGEIVNSFSFPEQKIEMTSQYKINDIYNKEYLYVTEFDKPLFEIPLREFPNVGSEMVYKCPKDAKVYVLDKSDKLFYKVSVDGQEGYLSKNQLKKQ